MAMLDDYNEKLPEIQKIPESEIKNFYTIPFENNLIEAQKIHTFCMQNEEKLIKNDLDKNLLHDLPKRINAFEQAQFNYNKVLYAQKEMLSEWQQKSPEVYDFRKDLIVTLRYLFKKMPKQLEQVNVIAGKQSQPEVVIGLHELALLAKEHIELFKKIEFDISHIDTAITKSTELRAILAKRNLDEKSNPVRIIRDKAYTYLKIALDAVCETGQFVFKNEPDKKAVFQSDYLRRYKSRNKSKNKNETKDDNTEKKVDN
jgi:hypothetical protein